MRNATKVFINTMILYIKIIVTTVVSLVSVPMILHALGESDYGLYNLLASVITMLGFLNASMSVSTQRFLSVAIGERNVNRFNNIYNSAIVLHAVLGVIIVIIFEISALFVFDGKLNIDPERVKAAKFVYQCLVVSILFTVMSVPFGAVLNAKENMLAIAIVDIIDSIFKLLVAIYLSYCSFDKLSTYAFAMMLISIFTALFYLIYVKISCREFSLSVFRYFRKSTFREMIGFTSWNTFASIAMIGRNQGTAVLLNLFFGTIANTAYGISNQINGVLNTFSSTFQRAINPQIMQSEGMGNRDRLMKISFLSSKMSVLVLCIFAVPLIIELEYILQLWLISIPEYTVILCRFVLILSIVVQFSPGLMSAIQATGKIRNYQLIMSVIILLNVPLIYFALKLGLPIYSSVIIFIILECFALITRIFMARKIVGIDRMAFFKDVILRSLLCILVSFIGAYIVHCCIETSFWRLIIVVLVYEFFYFGSIWIVGLSVEEKVIFGPIFNLIKIGNMKNLKN